MILDVEEPTLDGETVRQPGVVPKLSATPGRVRRGSRGWGSTPTNPWRSLGTAAAQLVREEGVV